MLYAFVYTKMCVRLAVCADLPLGVPRDSEVVPCRMITFIVEDSTMSIHAFSYHTFGVVTPRKKQHHVYDAREDFSRVRTLIRFSHLSAVFLCVFQSIPLCFPPMLCGCPRHFLFCGLPWLFAMFVQ